jgi:hypothetical protein
LIQRRFEKRLAEQKALNIGGCMTNKVVTSDTSAPAGLVRRRWRKVPLATSLLLFISSVAALSQNSSTTFRGHTPPKVLDGTATPVQHYDPSQMLRLSFVLTPPHIDEERTLIEQLHDKKSPLFHQFLTAEQFNARFAPSAADEESLVTWAQSQGLTITHRYSSRLAVGVEAPAGVIEKALNIKLNNYKLDTRSFFSNDRDPVLPTTLATVVHSVQGLNSLERMEPATNIGTRVTPPDYVPGPPVTVQEAQGADSEAPLTEVSGIASSRARTLQPEFVNGYFDPQDLYSSQAYNYQGLYNQGHCCNPLGNPGNSPPETSIAIAAFGDLAYSDMGTFHTLYPYLAFLVQKIIVDGGYTCNNSNGGDSNCTEVTWDTEWSTAMANSFGSQVNTAKVWVYEGPNANDATPVYMQMLDDGHARIFSTSWGCSDGIGCPDSTMAAYDDIFISMSIQGWTMVAAAGDQGATGACTDQLDVVYPASDPFVVAAGGTLLELYTNGTFYSEVTWTGGTAPGSCSNNYGGGTGGFSSYFNTPSFQLSLLGYTSRATPDLSLNAQNGQGSVFDGAFAHPGGTSLVAPELAGFFAQENAYLLSIGNACGSSGTSACAPLGYADYYLYGNDISTANHYPYYDVTSGCNSNDITRQYGLNPYCAKPGFDQTTGWGSANMLQLAWALNWSLAGSSAGPSITFSGPPTGQWYNTNQTVYWKVTDNASGSTAPTGIAGFTQGWDSIPTDPSREATPGAGNSFYSGPQFPNATRGCLSLASGGACSGGVTQGCHVANVQAWNNMGSTSGDVPYGYLCYDNVPPTVSASKSPAANSAGWNNTAVTVTLTASDPGGNNASGIKATYYGFDSTHCNTTAISSCQVYSAPFSFNTQGYNLGIYFAEDKAGNLSSLALIGINIDETAPVTTSTLAGTLSGGTYVTAVQVTLTATDSVSGVASRTYSLDGGANTAYTVPFTVSTPGSHILRYFSADVAGNVENPHTMTLSIASPTTTTLTVSPNPTNVAQTVTLKAAVAASLSGTPTGTVTFKHATTTIGTATLAAGAASLTTTALPLGADSLTATYAGATYFLTSTSAAVSEDIRQTTTTKLTSSLNPSTYGQSVTFTASVTPATSGTPTGSVEFLDGSTLLETVTLSGGKATLATSTLSAAAHTITAVYEASSSYAGSTSAAVTQTVKKAATTTTLATSVTPSTFGEAVKFTASVKTSAVGAPTGTVTFEENGTSIGAATLSSGEAAFTTETLPVGTHTITAVYSGSADLSTSTSAGIAEVTTAAKTTTTLTASPNPSADGASVTFTVKVTAATGPVPTGTVTLKNGSATIGSAALNTAGTVAFSDSTLTVGTHSITAVYAGSTDDLTSTSAAVAQVVQ